MSAEFPSHPQPPHFDTALGAWVLSRYQDILAAFREPRLWPVSAKSELKSETYDEAAQSQTRAETLAVLSPAMLAQWRDQMDAQARHIMNDLPANRPVDLVREFIQPWCLAAAVIVTGADQNDAERLNLLARDVSAAAAEPYDSALRSRASAANAELDRNFQTQPAPLRAPTFVALSQTLACLLANSWAALAQWPKEYAKLCAQPDLLPKAIEELLRYAGIPRTLFHRATTKVDVGGVTIAQGQRVILQIDSANRDPNQFPDPNRLDVTRPPAGHLAFGAGGHSCVGATLIRMALHVATAALIQTFQSVKLHDSVEWRGGAGFRTPASLNVILHREASRTTFPQ